MVDTARRAVAELAASQHRAFTRKQAAELNFDSRRIATAKRDGWIAEPIPGVLVIADGALTWEQQLHALVLGTIGRGVVSHRSAARLYGFDGFGERSNATLELTVPTQVRFRPRIASVIHQTDALDPIDVTRVKGFPCVTRERALSELGTVVRGVRPVRKALSSARRKGLDLDRTRATAERLHRPGQRGTGLLIRLLDSIPWEGRLPDTWFEELLALCLVDPTLPEMQFQYPIRDSHGTIVARPDIAFPSVRLGLEAHSRQFHFDEDAQALDEDRDIAAGLCGWELTYLGWYATKRPAAVLQVVKELIAVRARDLRRGVA